MSSARAIEFEGRTYEWSYDPGAISGDSCWTWSDVANQMRPPAAVVAQLNRLFIDSIDDPIPLLEIEGDLSRLKELLLSMGAIGTDFERPGLRLFMTIWDPDRATELRFERRLSEQALALNPFNCVELRNWLFASEGGTVSLPASVCLMGSGPFDTEELAAFLETQDIEVVDDAVGRLILGRQDWDVEELDDLIDLHQGDKLRIYSQEMFLTMMLSRHDPFAAGDSVLAAFRAGHPGLEFVSEGWVGWVTTDVPFDRAQASSSRSGIAKDWQDRSPLTVLGYRVGKDGLGYSERRRILQSAFRGPLPQVGSLSYMAKWGEPDTPERLKEIADRLALNCRINKKRANPSLQAISEWEDDLDWLKDSFYRGHMAFHWPGTDIGTP